MAKTTNYTVSSAQWVQVPSVSQCTLFNNHDTLTVLVVVDDTATHIASTPYANSSMLTIPPETSRSLSGLTGGTDIIWLRLREGVSAGKTATVTVLA